MINSASEQKTIQLLEIERSLRQSLNQFEGYYVRATEIDAATRQNNQAIIRVLYDAISQSMKPLEYILRFLTDSDIMNVAATCRALYRLVYSPLGLHICRYLRPIVIIKQESLEQQIPQFSQTTVDQLCSDRSLEHADEDDKMAILLTMKTNILATKQKVRELDLIIQAYDQKSQRLMEKIMYIGGEREDLHRKIGSLHDEIEKLKELLKVSQGHAQSLRQEQENMQMERQTKMLLLNEQKAKLLRQKDLLIKKIKSQQKQKEEGMIYAKQVSRVLGRLNQITMGAMGNNKK